MHNFFLCFINALEEFFMFFILACGFLNTDKIKYLKKALIILIPHSILVTIIEVCVPSSLAQFLLNFIVLTISLLFIFKRSLYYNVILYILLLTFSISIQLVLVLVFGIINLDLSEPFIPLVGNFASIIISYFISRYIPIYLLFQFICQKNRSIIIIVLNIFVVTSIFNIYNKEYTHGLFELLLSFIIPISILIMVNFIMIKEQLEITLKNKQLECYKTYIPVINKMIDELRARQHNFDNQLTAINGLPEVYHDYNQLKDALQNYTDSISVSPYDKLILSLNYKLVAAFLYQKINDTDSKNTNLKVDILTSNLSTIVPEFELIDIIGIMFDNMVEASGDFCHFILSSSNNKVFISTENPGPVLSEELMSKMVSKGYTTKNNSDHTHGMGLYNLNNYVKKYNGKLFMDNVITPEGVTLINISVEI